MEDMEQFTKYIADDTHYTEVIQRIPLVKRQLWIGTADIKDLYVARGKQAVPLLAVLAGIEHGGGEPLEVQAVGRRSVPDARGARADAHARVVFSAVEHHHTAVVHGAEIALLPVDPQAGLTINEALQNRRSWREYAAEPLSLEELSGVLWAAAGVNRPEEGRLTAPSALALYPIRVYAFFAEGVYRYDAPAHKLVRVAEGDLRNLSAAQPFAVAAPLNLVYIADLSVYADREIPAEKVHYLCGQDAAGCAENVNLYTAGHGLKSITRGSAPADELLKALGLDPAQYFFALAQTVGK